MRCAMGPTCILVRNASCVHVFCCFPGGVWAVLSRLAIVNRGEPALRLIRAVRQLNEEGRQDITVIALHTEAEQRALFVRAADEAVCLRDDASSGSPYLDHDELERALRLSRADAVWVGWGSSQRVRF